MTADAARAPVGYAPVGSDRHGPHQRGSEPMPLPEMALSGMEAAHTVVSAPVSPARPPLNAAAVMRLQRTQGNRTTSRLLQNRARSGAPAAGPATASRLVQREVGFEFEDGDPSSFKLLTPLTPAQLGQPPNLRTIPATQRDQIKKGTVIHAGTGFELQADTVDNSKDMVTGKSRSDLEFVTPHFPETDDGLRQLKTALTGIVALRGKLQALPQRDYTKGKFTWPDELQAVGIAAPDVVMSFTDFMHVVKMQATGAIRLDQIPTLMDMMVAKYSPATGPQTKQDKRHAAGHGVLIRQGGGASKAVAMAPAAADAAIRGFLVANSGRDPDVGRIKLSETGNLQGLLALIAHFLKLAEAYLSYPKGAAPIMPRTDYAQMFRMLPAVQRQAFAKNNAALWLDIAQRAIGGAPLGEQVFPPAIGANRPFAIELTREAWLKGMTTGTDLLTVDAYKKLAYDDYMYGRNPSEETLIDKIEQSKELQGLGGLKDKTEQVGAGVAAPIFELRSLSNAATAGEFPYQELPDVAVKIFKLIRDLNKMKDTAAYGK